MNFTALAALTLIAVPVQALPDLQEQSNTILKASLTAAKAGDWKTACHKYKENHAFETRHGLNEFERVTGSAQAQNLIHKANELRAESNAMTNENGEFLCGKAGMTWTTVNDPTTYSRSTPVTSVSSVSSNIRSRCEKEWGTDYRMVKYCIDKQTEAARSLGY